MTDQEILMIEGMNLLYSGMIVVFTFLLLLIISINMLRLIFSTSPPHKLEKTLPIDSADTVKVHHRIINEIFGDLR
jgi:Na+-transporting methylmalonyl-CoA/oxaloacetate decarboxylase gamma subunit